MLDALNLGAYRRSCARGRETPGVELRTEEVTLLILPTRVPGQKTQSDLLLSLMLRYLVTGHQVHAPKPLLGCFLYLNTHPVEALLLPSGQTLFFKLFWNPHDGSWLVFPLLAPTLTLFVLRCLF